MRSCMKCLKIITDEKGEWKDCGETLCVLHPDNPLTTSANGVD